MKTLDRYIVRSFLYSVLLWFVVLMALRIITDLFVNMDEFTEGDESIPEVLWSIFTYYRYHALTYFIELGGVIIVASAAFTLARMNESNELTAMLASGLNLHRVVWPIILCCIAMDVLVVIDQEFIIPRYTRQLARDRDEKPSMAARKFEITLIPDGRGTVWNAKNFRAGDEVMEQPVAVIRDAQANSLARASGVTARPGKLAGRPGWFFTGVRIARITREGNPWHYTPTQDRVHTSIDPQEILRRAKQVAAEAGIKVPSDKETRWVEAPPAVEDPTYGMVLVADRLDLDPPRPGVPRGGRLTHARFSFVADTAEGRVPLGTFVADAAAWRQPEGGSPHWQLVNGRFFYPSDLTTDYLLLRQCSRWLSYMSTSQLTDLLQLKRVRSQAALLTRHTRFTDPINNVIMLMLSLPFILSRERRIRASASRVLLVVGLFYMCIYGCRYINLSPQLAAWLPILIFGPAAVLMYDSVKT